MVPIFSLRKCAVPALCLGLLAVAGCDKGESTATGPRAAGPGAPSAPATPPPQKSATPNSFDEVAAQLDPGGDFYLYLSTAQSLGRLSAGIDSLHAMALAGPGGGVPGPNAAQTDTGFALLKDIVNKSGLEEVSGVGASSFAVSPGLQRNKFFIHHYAGKGSGLLWSLGGKQPHALTALDFLPADAALAAFGDFDLAQLIAFVRQEAEVSGIPQAKESVDQWQTQFAGMTGLQVDDVLASLNGALGMVLTLDATSTISMPVDGTPQTFPAPRLALLIAVKNDLIFKQVEKMMGGNPGVLKTDDAELRMLTMPVPFFPGLNLRPSVAQWNGFLVLATDDQVIRSMAAVLKGAPGYKSTAEYATFSAGLPQLGNSFWLATGAFADTLGKIQGQMHPAQNGPNAAQAAMLQQWLTAYHKSAHGFGVGVNLPNGSLHISQTSKAGP